MVALRRPDEFPPPPHDGLPTRAIKPHTHDKLHYWGCYLEASSTATKHAFPGKRVCADLFCAPGVCTDTKTLERVRGTALLSLQVAWPFDLYFFNDLDETATAALAQRAREIGVAGASVFTLDMRERDWHRKAREIADVLTMGPKIVVSTGDANKAHLALKVVSPPGRRYTLAVVDPTSAMYEWTALEGLAYGERALDVLLLFPDEMDLGRGLPYYLRNGAKLDRCFDGNADWRAVAKSSPHPASALRELYEARMRTLIGLEVGRAKTVTIPEKKRALYRLVFASRSKFAIKLWKNVVRLSRDRQDEFYLDV